MSLLITSLDAEKRSSVWVVGMLLVMFSIWKLYLSFYVFTILPLWFSLFAISVAKVVPSKHGTGVAAKTYHETYESINRVSALDGIHTDHLQFVQWVTDLYFTHNWKSTLAILLYLFKINIYRFYFINIVLVLVVVVALVVVVVVFLLINNTFHFYFVL